MTGLCWFRKYSDSFCANSHSQRGKLSALTGSISVPNCSVLPPKIDQTLFMGLEVTWTVQSSAGYCLVRVLFYVDSASLVSSELG